MIVVLETGPTLDTRWLKVGVKTFLSTDTPVGPSFVVVSVETEVHGHRNTS